MANRSGTFGENVELTEWSHTTSCPSQSLNPLPNPSHLHSEDEGDESDADGETFHDAFETLTTPQERPLSILSRTLDFFKSKASLLGKWVRVFYAAVMVVGMTMGLVFTYLQWRQQALANELSKMQACTQTVDASVSSSLCSDMLQSGESSRLSPRNDYMDSFALPLPSSMAAPHILRYLLGAVLVTALIFATRSILPRRREPSISENGTAEDEGFAPTLHIPYHIPRSKLTSFEALSTPLELLTPNLHRLLAWVWEGSVNQPEYFEVLDNLPNKGPIQESMLRHARHLRLRWWSSKSLQNTAATSINSDVQVQEKASEDYLSDTVYDSATEHSDFDTWLPLESRVRELQDDDQEDSVPGDVSEDGLLDQDARLRSETAENGLNEGVSNTLESSKNDLLGLFDHILRLQDLEQTRTTSTRDSEQKEIVRMPWHSSIFSNFQATEAFRVRSLAQSNTSDDLSNDPPKGRDYRFLDVPLPRNAFISPSSYLSESDDEEVLDEWLPTARSADAAEALLARSRSPDG